MEAIQRQEAETLTHMRDQELFEQGISYFHKGKISEGMSSLEEAHQLNPDHVDAIGHLAWACLTNGKPQRAIELYECLVEKMPQFAEAVFRLEQARMARDGYDRAA